MAASGGARGRAPSVSLVLGSGGARGYAHIGAIEAIEAAGLRIAAITGSSMGALVGGIHAAGRLDAWRDWALALTRFDVLRLVDLGLSGGGFIKGERIMSVLRDLVGDLDIEDLPVPFTAVAADLDAGREIWFRRGPLFDAIRASIAIPTVFRPVTWHGRTLVDGGLLNPVPVSATLGDQTEFTIAVDVNAAPGPRGPERIASPASPGTPASADATDADNGHLASLRQRISRFVDELLPGGDGSPAVPAAEPGKLELTARSLDVVQATLTRYKLAAQPPDLLIRVPRDACTFYEFDCARKLIELGRERAEAALAEWFAGG
ncbi:MAG: patatin-like phospholipase family protein [Xanthomonadales bacterium]|nr:patatin-like phospholipase family protein [Xanthomonadales bacterium]